MSKIIMEKIENSSNISELGYDGEGQLLRVRFKSGHLYEYAGIEGRIFDELKLAPSKGKYINMHIAKNPAYKYIKIQEEKVEDKIEKLGA